MGKNKKKKKHQQPQNQAAALVTPERVEANTPIVEEAPLLDAAEAAERVGKRNALEEEIDKLRGERMVAIEKELASLRDERLRGIQSDVEQLRHFLHEQMADQQKAWEEQIHCQREAWEKEKGEMHELLGQRKAEIDTFQQTIRTQQEELRTQKASLDAREMELDRQKAELEAREFEAKKKQELGERTIKLYKERKLKFDDEVEEAVKSQIAEREKTQALQLQGAQDEASSLRLEVQTLQSRLSSLQERFGNDPNAVLAELAERDSTIKHLEEELTRRPPEDVAAECEQLRTEKDRLLQENAKLRERIAKLGEEVRVVDDLKEENYYAKKEAEKVKFLEEQVTFIQQQFDNLKAKYEPVPGQDARINEIERPLITRGLPEEPLKSGDVDQAVDEIDWLNRIAARCDDFGLHFSPRILKAFHTAIKTAEWSPLTVLAGVSGTGKSELPRLYSHFGGLFCEQISVQPNWDSQESVLGYFNSIDNKFDAQPLLRFLAQSQKQLTDDYPGLRDFICMVLLDEMNLAHPELYFAEFLSKLETRRGMRGDVPPSLSVKTGAGIPPYMLPLGRNVFWTGTMNQDETTQSLSDKVLDRSIIIHFPRPRELKRRTVLKALDERNRGPLLHRKAFFNWIKRKSPFDDNQIAPYKQFLEDINEKLSKVGRAIGHRVWQAVEYYMANYPDVREAFEGNDKDQQEKAMHIAFEDQLVQKVMPKLRGIDTRGTSKEECLDKVLELLNRGVHDMRFNLEEDFKEACKLGYGQFVWQSANYINDEESLAEKRESIAASPPPVNGSAASPDGADGIGRAQDASSPEAVSENA